MTENRIGPMSIGSLTTDNTVFSVTAEANDGVVGVDQTEHVNDEFDQQWSYYTDITDIQEVIDAKAEWTIGKGFEADELTTALLDTIKGYGKDTFNSILENMIATMEIGEDAYAEIITDDKGNLVNLKPLNTGSMKIIVSKKGIIKRYEQISRTPGRTNKRYKLEQIFHLCRNRRGDEVHGRSMIDVLVTLIKAKQEAIEDYQKVMHRFVKPQWKFRLKTDDAAEIAAYKAKMDAATGTGENIYEPFDVSESEIMALSPNATLNPVAWINYLDAAFYKAAGVPQFIAGGGVGFTNASEKIAYLAWQQRIEKKQLFIEEQTLAQLNLVITLTFPASIENDLISENQKDGPENIDASDTTAGEAP